MDAIVPPWGFIALALALIPLYLAMNAVIDRMPVWWAQLKSKWSEGNWHSESVDRVKSRHRQRHNETAVKVSLILAVAVVASVWMLMYFAPYQTCVRSFAEDITLRDDPAERARVGAAICAARLGKMK